MNEKRNIQRTVWGSIAGFFIVSLLGTVWHYLYGFSGGNAFVGIFAPINESVWEHLKLLFYPFLLYVMAEYLLFGRHIGGFVYSMTIGLLCGLIFIPLCLYAYNIFTHSAITALDIIIYYLAVAVTFFIGTERIVSRRDASSDKDPRAAVIIAALILAFTVLTFLPL